MDLQRIYDALRVRVEADRQDYKAIRLSRKLRKKIARAKHQAQNLEMRVAPLRNSIKRGGRMLALDCEWTMYRPLTEVGLTVYEKGELTFRNIQVAPKPGSTAAVKDGFLFGTTEVMEFGDVIRVVNDEVHRCDLLVGHALINDRKQLSEWVVMHDRIFDTLTYGRSAYPGEKLKLKHMMHRVGLKANGAHNGGNDAAMTMFVALSLIGLQNECRGAVLHGEPLMRFPVKRVDKPAVR